ncbi:MAG TPA: molecular chaperone TorD family protein [Enterovirga sp.]
MSVDALGSAPPRMDRDEVDLARAGEYALLSNLLAEAPDSDLLAALARLPGDGTPLGSAHAALAQAAAATDAAAVEREYFDLFVGLGRGELLPYASYYLTGFLHERPLARIREDLAGLGVERDPQRSEPEDHLALLCEVMAGLAQGSFDATEAEQARFFARHLRPWAEKFFADLEAAKSARFYRAVAGYGRAFLAIEGEAFTIAQ